MKQMKRLSLEDRLTRLGAELREPLSCRAAGTCFALSLSLAFAAEAIGCKVNLVRWTLRNDSSFADHWALQLPSGLIIDTTSSQFDANAKMLRRVNEYPANFVGVQVFAAEEFTRVVRSKHMNAVDYLPPEAMFHLFLVRLRLMWVKAVASQDVVGLALVVREAAVGSLRLCLQTSGVYLHGRRAILKKRLATHAARH